MAGSRSAGLGNLPADLTNFVDREREVAAVKRLLRHHRLVTLTGGPGMGKTRLALRVARRLGDTFADGVWLVELAALEDARFLDQTVACAVGMPGEPEAAAAREGLSQFLAGKNLLLVLDSCDHLVDACASLVTDLLRAAPRLRIMATSRQALGAPGERLVALPPLPMPREDQRSPARNDAARLFAECAAIARPGFAITRSNRVRVAEVCRRLEGIPLAIELAAVRVRAMPVEAILTRLKEHPLEILDAGARVAMPRLQTLETAIDWSSTCVRRRSGGCGRGRRCSAEGSTSTTPSGSAPEPGSRPRRCSHSWPVWWTSPY